MKVFIAAAALALVAVPAFADAPWSATPSEKSSKSDIVAGGVSWNCAPEGCRSSSDTSNADEMWACRDLARQVGGLSDFQGRGRPYDAKRLASCNADAAKSHR